MSAAHGRRSAACWLAVELSPTSGARFPVGLTTVTAAATDGYGNRGQCTFTVTVRPAAPAPAAPVLVPEARWERTADIEVGHATLGAAAAAVGLALDRHVVAALDGDRITRDPGLPLVAGDTVAFLSADAGG